MDKLIGKGYSPIVADDIIEPYAGDQVHLGPMTLTTLKLPSNH